MKNAHIKNYRKAWNLGEQDTVLCERCGRVGIEIHHIAYRSHGGSDEFGNLIGLCRGCHNDWAHWLGSGHEKVYAAKRWPGGIRKEKHERKEEAPQESSQARS